MNPSPVVAPIDQLRPLLHELARQWRAEGGSSREQCALELERLLEAFERGGIEAGDPAP